MSATLRSLVYFVALARSRLHGGLTLLLVEMVYVTATAGLYAGLQQRALALRSRLLGNFCVVLVVPCLAQLLDWLSHRAVGPAAPPCALISVCVFTLLSALFHLHVMRRGAFLTGGGGRTLADDFRRMPQLLLGFILQPANLLAGLGARFVRAAESEAAL